jgi:uncharacterized protein YbgA (DUF1722 family)/uncharacterized protein YbbK (DUF523 family)
MSKPKIGVSSCLLGIKVRHDGGHKHDRFITDVLGLYVEWVSVCPEFELGMGVPRESVRLVGTVRNPRMIAEKSGTDWTERMDNYRKERVARLKKLQLSGYILKKNSPSCGMERVPVYGKSGMPNRQGRGLFAYELMTQLALLPAEEEGRLNDSGLRENFIERVFAYHRWLDLTAKIDSISELVEFHTRHKFLLLAHSEPHYRKLGRLVGDAKKHRRDIVMKSYGRLFMEALKVPATVRKHVNVLQHILGYFSEHLTVAERAEILTVIQDYHKKLTPLIVPLTLIRHYVNKYEVGYIQNQWYLEPDPKELMLQNHV